MIRTCSGTNLYWDEPPSMNPPGMNLHWDETSINMSKRAKKERRRKRLLHLVFELLLLELQDRSAKRLAGAPNALLRVHIFLRALIAPQMAHIIVSWNTLCSYRSAFCMCTCTYCIVEGPGANCSCKAPIAVTYRAHFTFCIFLCANSIIIGQQYHRSFMQGPERPGSSGPKPLGQRYFRGAVCYWSVLVVDLAAFY